MLPDETPPLWAQRRETRLLLPPVQPGVQRVTVRAAAAGPGQTLALRVNGVDTPAQPLPETWSELSFDLPAGALGEQVNDVQLRFGQTYPVNARLDGAPVGLLVESAGLEAGNYAHIWLNGVDLAPNERGYNLAILDGQTWQPRAVAAFDTHADPAASAALVEFLSQMDNDSVLAVAVRDTASQQLSDEAAQALANLGLDRSARPLPLGPGRHRAGRQPGRRPAPGRRADRRPARPSAPAMAPAGASHKPQGRCNGCASSPLRRSRRFREPAVEPSNPADHGSAGSKRDDEKPVTLVT